MHTNKDSIIENTQVWDQILASPEGLEVFEGLMKQAQQEVKDGKTQED